MAWGSTWGNESKKDSDIVTTAKKQFEICQNWEATARVRFDYDHKFANGDTHNKYQWDDKLVYDRELSDKPCLTINKTQQHNLLIINDAKQNKPGVRIRPVGDEASFEAAQVFQELIYHIEYISGAENVYDSATTWQVEAGMGYWRICTDYISDDDFNQEIYIKRIKDPRSVYLDPDINEVDGSDARFGFIFEDKPKELFLKEYPEFKDIGTRAALGNSEDNWLNKDHIRVAEYYVREEKEEKLVTFIDPQTKQRIKAKYNELSDEGKQVYSQVKKEPTSKERKIVTKNIKWYLIAGDTIIDQTDWLGKYIPIVRLPGIETVIDGVLDRKGHTRALINAQQIYNYNTSANVEYGALQTKSPWLVPVDAVEGLDDYWSTANVKNHSYLPYHHMDEDGGIIPPPSRPVGPQSSPAYVQQLQIAQNEMMMASGQYQSQFGENENAKSGVAINARQRQGDRATYHFPDNQAIAIRYTGKILIDLIPKIYDTERVINITSRDNKKVKVNIDPEAQEPVKKVENPNQDMDPAKRIEEIVFNPNIGIYDLQADTGPSFATKRMEGFNALTQIASQNKDFMNMIGGDIYFKFADFPGADILADRYERIIPPNVKGEAPDPHTEQVMHQASDMIEKLQTQLAQISQELENKKMDFALRQQEHELKQKQTAVAEIRLDYEAETKRLVALGNSGPAVDPAQIQPVLRQLIVGMLNAGEPGAGDRAAAEYDRMQDQMRGNGGASSEEPPVPDARKAPDGNWYVQKDGKYYRVDEDQGQEPQSEVA